MQCAAVILLVDLNVISVLTTKCLRAKLVKRNVLCCLHNVGKKKQQFSDDDDDSSKGCSCCLLRRGWFWAVLIVVSVICVSVNGSARPIALLH
jgi:hypothetical protein